MSGVSVCVAGRAEFPGARLRVARSVTTDAKGRFKDTLRRGPSRRVFFVTRVPGGAASASLNVRVRAPVRLSARELVSGQALEFRGMVRGKPIPRRGVLVDLQVRKRGTWQDFKTTRAKRHGRFRYVYRFTTTTGLRRFRFRARVPAQAGYPYVAGGSRPIDVTVHG